MSPPMLARSSDSASCILTPTLRGGRELLNLARGMTGMSNAFSQLSWGPVPELCRRAWS